MVLSSVHCRPFWPPVHGTRPVSCGTYLRGRETSRHYSTAQMVSSALLDPYAISHDPNIVSHDLYVSHDPYIVSHDSCISIFVVEV